MSKSEERPLFLEFMEKNQNLLSTEAKMWILNEKVVNGERQKVDNLVVMFSNKCSINKVEVEYLDDKGQERNAREVILEGILKAASQMLDVLEKK